MITVSTWSGRTPADSSVALHAWACNWVPVTFFKVPPNVPNAVRFAPTMKIPLIKMPCHINKIALLINFTVQNNNNICCSDNICFSFLKLSRFSKINKMDCFEITQIDWSKFKQTQIIETNKILSNHAYLFKFSGKLPDLEKFYLPFVAADIFLLFYSELIKWFVELTRLSTLKKKK